MSIGTNVIFISDPDYSRLLKAHNGKFCVYRLLHIPTEKYYFGSTSSLCARILRHLRELTTGKHHNRKLLEIFKDIGEFAVTVKHYNTREECQQAEQELIDIHHGHETCLNVGDSAVGAWKVVPEEMREIISKAQTGRPSLTKGVPRSEEDKRKISESTRRALVGKPGPNAGKTLSPETRAKVGAANAKPVSIAGTIYKGGVAEAARALGLPYRKLVKWVVGDSPKHVDKFYCDLDPLIMPN